jgi:uncharacterized protein
MASFLGASYPIVVHPNGYLHTIKGLDTVRSDLLVLLMTNPGERVMLPNFGCPLRSLIFEQNDSFTADTVQTMIANAIRLWEPRVAIDAIDVRIGRDEIDSKDLNSADTKEDLDNMMFIKILFKDFDNIQEVQSLELQIPLAGT